MDEFSMIDNARKTFHESSVICPVHGESRATSIFCREPKCIQCIEDEVFAEQVNSIRLRDEATKVQQFDIALRRSGIPERYFGATFDRYQAKDGDQALVLSRVKVFSESVGSGWRCLTLLGFPGTGKTHLAVSVALDVMGRGLTARYVSFPLLVDKLIRTRSFTSEISREELLGELCTPDVLIIDEVGMIGLGADSVNQVPAAIYDVINARYNAMKSVILASNGDMIDLEAVLGERVIERLRENGGKFFPMMWNSFRKEGGA